MKIWWRYVGDEVEGRVNYVSKRSVLEYYKQQREDYQRMYANPRNAFKKRRRIEATQDFLRQWQPKMGRVLDIGCGDGYFVSQVLKGRSWLAYVGVDLSVPKLLSFRKRIEASRVISADAEALPFPSNTFDTVLCFETLEHLIDPAAAVREMSRVLKPGGLIVLSTPFVSTLHALGKRWLVRLFSALDSQEGFEEHLQEFTSRRLHRLLCQSGFRLVAQKACVYHFAILDSLFRYLPYDWYRRIDEWLAHFPFGVFGVGKLRISVGAEYILVASQRPYGGRRRGT